MTINFKVNGIPHKTNAKPESRLIDVLRNELGLSGTKEACGEGKCGSCTILMDGKLSLACITPVIRAANKEIITIESLSKSGVPNFIQKAFIDADAIQCGFCTPGLIMTVKKYIDKGGTNDREEIKKVISGNLCRCTGYTKIIDAVELAFKYKDEDKTTT